MNTAIVSKVKNTMFREEGECKCKDNNTCTNAFRLPPLLIEHSCLLRSMLGEGNSDTDEDNHTEDDMNTYVAVLFNNDPQNILWALEYVCKGTVEPKSIAVLSRLLLSPATPEARRKMLLMPGEGATNEVALLRRVIHQELLLRPLDDPYRMRLWEACQERKIGRALLLWTTTKEQAKYTKYADSDLESIVQAGEDPWWWMRHSLLNENVVWKEKSHAILMKCAQRGCIRSFRLFVKWVEVDGVFLNNLFHWASRHGHIAVVKCLCELDSSRGVNPSAKNNDALRSASYNGHIAVVKYLCELDSSRGVNPSAKNNDAFQRAAENGHLDVVKYLCELDSSRGVDPSADGNWALMQAALYGHIAVVRYLCELDPSRGVNPSANNNGALLRAVFTGRVGIVNYLCDLDPLRRVELSTDEYRIAIQSGARRKSQYVVQYMRALGL